MSHITARTVLGDSPVYDDVRKDLTQTDDAIQMLERARLFVPLILAGGVLLERDGSPWHDLIEPMANVTGELTKVEEGKERLIERLEKLLGASPETLELTEEIAQLPYTYSHYHGRAAYLLGLVVGQHLGPDAFRKSGAR